MRRLLLSLLLILVGSATAGAQTTSSMLAWSHADSLVNVQGYTFVLKIDAATAVVVPGTCAAAGAVVNCTTPLVTPLNQPHTLVLQAVNAAGTASATLNYVPPPNPVPANQLKVIIQITVP